MYTPLSVEETCDYIRCYSNVCGWDQITLSAEQLSDAEWVASLTKWPAVLMKYTRIEATEGESRIIAFEGTNQGGQVKTTERYTIRDASEKGTSIAYTMQLGLSGWRRIPCIGAAVWVHLRSESSRAYEKLRENLEAIHGNVV